MIRSRKAEKRMDDRRHPCLTTTCSEPFSYAAIHRDCDYCLVVELLNGANWICTDLYFRMVDHKPVCHTLSKPFFKNQ